MNRLAKYTCFIVAIGFTQNLTSCTTLAVPNKFPDDISKNMIVLNYQLNRLEIIDNRKDTTSLSLKLPAISTKTQTFEVNPTLTNQQRVNIELQIKSYFASNDTLPKVNIKLYLSQGSKRIEGSAIRVSEHTKIELKAEIYDITSERKIIGYGSASYDVPMLNATEKHLNQLFDITLKNAINICFSKVDEFY